MTFLGSETKMAESKSHSVLPHSRTKLLHKYTPFDYGPLARLPDAATVVGSFRGGSYYQTMVEMEEGVVLYRLHDDIRASAYGRYWTLENREGVLSDRIDLAVPLKWNDLTKTNSLVVPKGVFLYEGPIAPQSGGPIGGGWQIFIPGEVLKPLCMAMELRREDSSTERQTKIEQYIQEAKLNQIAFLEVYERELNKLNHDIIDKFCKSTNAETFLTTGNNLSNLDAQICSMLATLHALGSLGGAGDEATVVAMAGKVGSGSTTYLLHSEELRMADGSMKCMTLYAKVEHSLENVTFEWM